MPSASRKPSPPNKGAVRLNKYLASCGAGSRRACDRLIEEGRVAVDGTTVTSHGVTVSPFQNRVTLDGRELRPESTRVLMVHKPRNVICTVSDPEGRKTILELLPEEWRSLRLYPVGRLDRNSEGLILVTNDGDLANRLTHPRYELEKEYLVWVREELQQDQGEAMLDGVQSEGERLSALAVTPIPTKGRYHCYLMVLGEGRNRHIRRMCEAVDVEVVRIKRIRMAGLDVQELGPGEFRELAGRELAELRRNVGL